MSDKTKRRIAYVLPQGELGGAEIATLHVLEAHDRERFDLFAILFKPGPITERLTDLDVPWTCAAEVPRLRRGVDRRRARRWIQATLRERDVHLQHSVMAWTHSLAGPAAQAAGIPAVWSRHTPPKWSNVIDWHAGFTSTRCVINNSTFTSNKHQSFNLRRFPSAVIHPPVGVGADGDTTRWRNEIGVDDQTILAVLPGRLQRPKGQDVAIRALAKAIPNAPALHLVLVGEAAFGLDANFPGELARLGAELTVSHRVHALGFHRDMDAVYAAGDMILVPSTRPEGFGLVVAEGLAAGKPVIASDIGAIPELIQDGVNGILVPPDDADALAGALARVAGNAELRLRLGEAARATRVNAPADTARELEALYERILET